MTLNGPKYAKKYFAIWGACANLVVITITCHFKNNYENVLSNIENLKKIQKFPFLNNLLFSIHDAFKNSWT